MESEEQCGQCGGEDGLAESAMANAGLITFATQGESAGRSSGRRTDQQHKQGSGSGKPITTKIRIKDSSTKSKAGTSNNDELPNLEEE